MGAHIRTLLLTFFYRHFPELVDGGHLYIAQPPLYRVVRGKSEIYRKDEQELAEYLTAQALNGSALTLENGEQRMGEDLNSTLEIARKAKAANGKLGIIQTAARDCLRNAALWY